MAIKACFLQKYGENLTTLPVSKFTDFEDYLRQQGWQEDRESFVHGGFIEFVVEAVSWSDIRRDAQVCASSGPCFCAIQKNMMAWAFDRWSKSQYLIHHANRNCLQPRYLGSSYMSFKPSKGPTTHLEAIFWGLQHHTLGDQPSITPNWATLTTHSILKASTVIWVLD